MNRMQKMNYILITGGTSGIGAATAEVFAKNGYNLLLTGRRADRLNKLSEALKASYDIQVETACFDVRDAQAVNEHISIWLARKELTIVGLINNAGLAKGFDSIDKGKLNDWNQMIDTNVKGLLYVSRLVSEYMVKNKSGHIVNVCSTAGHEVYPKGAVYCASKHAVDAITEGMRLDLHTQGIRVSQVSPGHVEETEFALVRFDGDQKKASIYEDFRPLRAVDVAETIWFIFNRPPHVNIQDVLMMGTQQASSIFIDRSGR